ncbi:MAG: DNA polymerase III subunit alpha [Candidatus Omnitrophica bacterium]|nr:DNA polymerase III subunit alpha [Candidatus Omnitrophota bacterium]
MNLREICVQLAPYRNIDLSDKVYSDQLDEEISVISPNGFDSYFLICADIINYCKIKGLPVNLRGSASGSLVVYLLGMSEIDPIKHGLSFARFLNKARIDGGIDSYPDIDIDVSKNYRKDVIQYIIDKYGEDRVCLIRNYNVSTLNSSIRNGVMKIWEGNITHSHVNNILKNTNLQDNETVEDVLNDSSNIDFINEYNKDGEFKKICDIANKMIGCVYSYGCHAGGVVIFDRPIHEIAPLTVTKQGFPSIQADKKDLSLVGGVKLDLLGLKALDDIYDASSNAEVNWLDFYHKFNLNDPKIYENVRDLKTDGVFTLETPASKACISEIKPTEFEDIIAVQALIRPGAKEYITDYAKVKNEGYNILDSHPYFKHIIDIIQPTYGVILYQEQIMKISQKLSGFSDSEADILRKAIGKKKMDLLEKMKDKFVNNSDNPNDAEKIWEVIQKAGNYSFNKSHAVAYAYISFASLYLKTYYPEHWYGALFKNSDNKEKLTQYIQTCEIDIKNPSILYSKKDIASQNQKLYFGFSLIKGAKNKYIEATLHYQQKCPDFNMYDFVAYTNIDKGTFNAFVMAGVFDDVGYKRSQLLNSSEMILELVKKNEDAIVMKDDKDYKIAKNLKTTTLLLEDDSLTKKADTINIVKDLDDFIMLSEIKYYWKHIKKHITNIKKNRYKKSKEYIIDQINLTHDNATRNGIFHMLELERDVLNFVVTVHPNKILELEGKNIDKMEEGDSNKEVAYIDSIKEAKTKNGNVYYKASAEFEKFQRYISVFTFKGQHKPEQGFNIVEYTTRTWNNKMYINVDNIKKI